MSTSTVRKQRLITARRQLVVDTGSIGVVRGPVLPEPSVSLLPPTSRSAVRRLVMRVLERIRDAAGSPARSAAEQRRYDAVYRNDEGGTGDDGGWG